MTEEEFANWLCMCIIPEDTDEDMLLYKYGKFAYEEDIVKMLKEKCDYMNNYRCNQEKSKRFEQSLKNCHIDLNSFIKLFNEWTEMTIEERKECVNKLGW